MPVKRPYAVYFPLKNSGRISREQVLESLRERVQDTEIRGIQITDNKCIISMTTREAKDQVGANGLNINSRHLSVVEVEKSVTNVTVKDAPIELEDEKIVEALRFYGNVVNVKRGYMKGTRIETGTRYLEMVNVSNTIPVDLHIGQLAIKVYCDNNKTACKFCECTDHPYFRCPARPREEKRCFRCQGTDHFISDCKNDIHCLLCGRSGHMRRDCAEQSDRIRAEEAGRNTMFVSDNQQTTTSAETQKIHSTQTPKVIAFRGPGHPFSNLYVVDDQVKYDGKLHRSVEHGYKQTKAIYYDKDELIEDIDKEKIPKEMMKMVNNALRNESEREEWITAREGVMSSLLESKFERCSEFREVLMGSEEAIIVEATIDSHWASGIPSVYRTEHTPPDDWPGKNKLGQLLMELRNKKRQEINDKKGSTDTPPQHAPDSTTYNPPEHSTPQNGAAAPALRNVVDTTEAANAEGIATPIVFQPFESPAMSPAGAGADQARIVNDNISTVVLGDSILNGAKCKNQDVKIVALSGAGYKQTNQLLNTVMDQKHPNLKNVVLALGGNDVRRMKSAPQTQLLMQDAIQAVQSNLPGVHVYVAGIVPMKGNTKDTIQTNQIGKLVNEFAQLLAQKNEDLHYISVEALFNLPHPNALARYYKDDKYGIHLNNGGKNDLINWIEQAILTATKSGTAKRTRSDNGTPPSAEKLAKAGRRDSAPSPQ